MTVGFQENHVSGKDVTLRKDFLGTWTSLVQRSLDMIAVYCSDHFGSYRRPEFDAGCLEVLESEISQCGENADLDSWLDEDACI